MEGESEHCIPWLYMIVSLLLRRGCPKPPLQAATRGFLKKIVTLLDKNLWSTVLSRAIVLIEIVF